MKNRDLINAVASINAVAELKDLSIPLSYAISLNLRAVKDHLAVFDELKEKVVNAHTVKDEAGKPAKVFNKTAEGKFIIDEETGEPSFVNGARKMDDQEATDRDYKALLDIDVSADVKLRPIKLSRLKDGKGAFIKGLEPRHFSDAFFMFVNDIESDVDANISAPAPVPA